MRKTESFAYFQFKEKSGRGGCPVKWGGEGGSKSPQIHIRSVPKCILRPLCP